MNDDAEINATAVDLQGLLSVLGANLYSSPDVALRELVQNAHDAISRRMIEVGANFEPRIEVGVVPKKRLVWVEDNGAGLTRDEVKLYLATIGAGYTRLLRQSSGETGLIGAFGLGFLSAYMIAKRVEVVSTSYADVNVAVRFVSDNGRKYAIENAPARPLGTRVEIELNDENAELADFARVARVLRSHCSLLKHPIVLAWSHERINDLPPPWRRSDLDGAPPVRLRRERLAFAKTQQDVFEPLCALPIHRNHPDDPGEGLVWIHDAAAYGSADNRRLGVFVRGMRVATNEREFLPVWAGFVSGAYEGDALTPTASREALQKDATYVAARAQIARELSAGLARLATEEPDVWRRVLRRHNEPLLGAAIADDALFEVIRDSLLVPTSQGDLPLSAVAEAGDGRVHLAQTDDAGLDGLLAHSLGAPIIDGMRYGAATFARRWSERTGVPLVEVGSARGLDVLLPRAAIADDEAAALKAWFGDDVRIRPARFSPASLPMLVIEDADATLKAFVESDEADARLGAGGLALARAFTKTIEGGPTRVVVVNLNCPAVGEALRRRDESTGAEGARALAALAQILGARGRKAGGRALATALEDISNALVALMEQRA